MTVAATMHTSGSPFGPVALSPVSFLDRAAAAYGSRVAVIDGDVELTYRQLADRCARLAGALVALGSAPGDRISVLAPNTHAMLEAHYGVPASGAVLNALNTRLSAQELAYIVEHAGSKALVCDRELLDVGHAVVGSIDRDITLIDCGTPDSTYEQLLAAAQPARVDVDDELALLSLNYTSGTTGQPKGVMYSHRGAYLQSLAMAAQGDLGASSVFLWTLPMFHCNGWCYPWAVTAVGGTHVALREVHPEAIWEALHQQRVTHFNAAPTVLSLLVSHGSAAPMPHRVRVATGGAPPSPTLISRLAAVHLDVTHLYGLTETYGPAVICDWWPEWDGLADEEQAALRARQGVANVVGQPLRVVDPAGLDVPADGVTQGEVVLRGNNVMLGYYRDEVATTAATVDGPGGSWFRTGDIGVLHQSGYLELRDRAKDIIISGGENITSIEVEQVIETHPAVLECAVVAGADETWGEVPIAFVTVREGAVATEAEIIEHVKARIARFKAPKRVVFGPLPKTSTGKIQKFHLRDRARGLSSPGPNPTGDERTSA